MPQYAPLPAAGESIILDPVTELATNSELGLSGTQSTGIVLLAHDYPPPERDVAAATSIDTEGELPHSRHWKNRTIPVRVRAYGSSAADLHVKLKTLQQKVAKLDREGGTYKRTTPSNLAIIFDVVGAEIKISSDRAFIHASRADVDLSFDARPFGRGVPVQLADRVETVLPVLTFVETGPAGDVPALAQVVVDDDQAQDQFFLHWGLQSRYYSADASAALFYEAESRTPQGGATVVGFTGASGGTGYCVEQAALSPAYQSMLSTQAAGAGSHLSHVGTFEVWARVLAPTTNTGVVKLCLEWSEGDFKRSTRNAEVTPLTGGVFSYVNLGQVSFLPVARGTQRWEGRVLAKSTVAGDDLEVDYLALFPSSEGYGEVRALAPAAGPTSFLARDEFDQTAGALAGKAAPTGGTWAGAGSATDFTVESTARTARRTLSTDGNIYVGRYAVVGATDYASVAVQADLKTSALPSLVSTLSMGVLARYIDVNNWLAWTVRPSTSSAGGRLYLQKRVAGTISDLAFVTGVTVPLNTTFELRLTVTSDGRWYVVYGTTALQGYDADLATGGALATGKPGFIDACDSGEAATRDYDNFAAWTPSADAAIFASQSLELRHDGVIREDSAGTIWQRPSRYEGDYPLAPAAGREARSNRWIFKACRNDPSTMPDTAIDDISARVTVTPRYLVVPE